ncbi:MAG: protein kinase, partial [Myxococcota bacterium]
MAPQDEPHTATDTLERYELLHKIASGGMAEVYLAKAYGAHGFEKRIAIKRILPNLVRSGRFEQRFITEAKLTAKLTHGNIVQILDFGRSGGTLFIAMEYVDGPNLAQLSKPDGQNRRALPMDAVLY